MKLKNISKSKRGGFTLVEITLVISLILGLIAVLVLGAQAYKDGSDRARCIMNISTAQKAVRSFGNLQERRPGEGYSDGFATDSSGKAIIPLDYYDAITSDTRPEQKGVKIVVTPPDERLEWLDGSGNRHLVEPYERRTIDGVNQPVSWVHRYSVLPGERLFGALRLDPIRGAKTWGEHTASGMTMEQALVGNESYIPDIFECPSEDTYLGWDGKNMPLVGSVALRCPKESTDNHRPKDFSGW